DRDRVLRAVADRQAGLVLELGRHRAVTSDHGIAVLVHVEHLRSQRIATVVALAELRVHGDAHARQRRQWPERAAQPTPAVQEEYRLVRRGPPSPTLRDRVSRLNKNPTAS